ncbi:amidase [Paracidovorax cattleyae]|uniref:Aspartyl-tRNA(Asn)/glutamyl-tRNA(Gln) amidotransferase subunit A n=1 Tax=Paracidovorax cattleyae TaxID=80868 RepID=A0A1H0UK67_9BURK|nr:amidase [Paracidovorax cattleyae]SDP66554.1 aspartyl-tRNA(Asn)/glutamyl-tRNA(Gln) amidotransferase subunit A [Paracidovorax cattleyae]
MSDRPTLPTIRELARSLAEGATTSEALVEAALERIAAHRAGGGAAYVGEVDALAARLAARASDLARAAGHMPSPLAGLPVSVKDLFDVRGQVTRAGSAVLADAAPAAHDAIAVARLRAAGAILLGRTNMSEFAFSGLGLNPHHGTPAHPQDAGRVTGGSSSGAAATVALDLAAAALGTDTGGSIRIPSAFCGLTGFKPTAHRVPLAGAYPLSRSLDSIGPLARSVDCCAILDAVLSGEGGDAAPAGAWPLAGMRMGVVQDLVMDGLEPEVAAAFESALRRLSAAGARIERVAFPELHALPRINAAGGLIAAEAWQVHRTRLVDASVSARYDPRVAQRTRRGEAILAADYIDVQDARARLQAAAQERLGHLDAWLMPTVAVRAPLREPLEQDDARFFATNALVLRNTSVVNFLDGCALSLPCEAPGELPVGLSVTGLHGADARILQAGRAVEACLRAD